MRRSGGGINEGQASLRPAAMIGGDSSSLQGEVDVWVSINTLPLGEWTLGFSRPLSRNPGYSPPGQEVLSKAWK